MRPGRRAKAEKDAPPSSTNFHPYCEVIREEIQRHFNGRDIRVFPTWAPRPESQPEGYDPIRIQLPRREGESVADFTQERYRMESLLDTREAELSAARSGAVRLLRQSEIEPAIPVFGKASGEGQAVVEWHFIAYVASAIVRDAGAEPRDFDRQDRRRRPGRMGEEFGRTAPAGGPE